MTRSSQPRKTASLSDSVHRQLQLIRTCCQRNRSASAGIRATVRGEDRRARISAASPIQSSTCNSASSRSNQRACPLASIPTRTF